MKVWFCEEHRAISDEAYCQLVDVGSVRPGDCRPVSMRLVPDGDTLVVERDEHGEWPEWAIHLNGGRAAPPIIILDGLFEIDAERRGWIDGKALDQEAPR